jgi:predicted Rossmann fold flavoprotein
LELIIQSNGKIYPQTLQASSVVSILEYEALRVGVKFILNTNINKLSFNDDKFNLFFNDTKQSFDKVIISSGSQAMPKLGSSDAGYNFAKEFGHTIIEPFASLVQLQSDNKQIKELSGVKINAKIELEINKESIQSELGDLLFTSYGLSGDTILDISRQASYALSIGSLVAVKIDIFPDIEKDNLISKLTKRLKNSNTKDKYFWLEGFIHKKLIRYIIDNCGIKANIQKADQLNKKDIMSLVYFIKNIKININNTKGFDTAEVSAGGVDVFEIDTKTMESKLQKNLYFTGEVLDVDGQCGGYNLHWAWASGYVCANGIINK